MTCSRVAALVVLVWVTDAGSAASQVLFEGFVGGAHSFSTPLTIRQAPHPDLELSARYETRPFELPPYYAWRVGVGSGRGAWEIQFVHHKVYLVANPPEVESFEITHGFNLLTFGRSWSRSWVTPRVGGGLVIAHPDSEVRGRPYSPGYRVTGPVVFAGVGRRFPLASRVFVTTDALLFAARARVPIDGGEASAPNVSAHFLLGLGARF